MTPRVFTASRLVHAVLLLFVAGAVPAAAVTDPALSPWTQTMLCAPRVLPAGQSMGGARVLGSYDGTPQAMFGPGDRLVLTADAGTLASGQYYLAQRAPRSRVWARHDDWLSSATQSAGLVRIDSVTGETAVGTVVWACDGVENGDRLQAFVAPQGPPAEAAAGQPSFEAGGTVLFGSQDRRMGAAPDLLLVTRAEGQAPASGQRVTFYRRAYGEGNLVSLIGEGTVQAVADRTFLVRIDRSVSAVSAGDEVGLQR